MARRTFAPRRMDRLRATNQPTLYLTRVSFEGGQNSRHDGAHIEETALTIATNVDLGVPGKLDKRPGLTLIANDVGTRTDALQSYYPTGASGLIYRKEGTNLRKWTGTGNWSASLGTVVAGDGTMIQGGESGENEVIFLQDNSGNPQRINSSDTFQDLGSGATSPPKSLINLFFRNRWWVLKNGFLYYSDAFPADYSTAFDGANGFRFSGHGSDRGLLPIRDDDSGTSAQIIVFMQNGIFAVAPSATPAATDKPVVITTAHGAVERKCITQVGDDILYLAPDGIRSLRRTVTDHMQVGASFPLSYALKDEFENIDWAYSAKFHTQYWENKFFFFFVQQGGTDINRAWVYWPANDVQKIGRGWAVLTGWTITSTEKFFKDGQQCLYGGSTDGKVYQLWTTNTDNSTAITMTVETREEDFGAPAIYKYGGEVEVVAEAVGNYNLTISASIDGGAYSTLGTMNLASGGPTLPINLPFDLASLSRKSQKFHLDSLGRFKRIKFKVENSDDTGDDKIRVYEINTATHSDQYDSEER